MPILLEALTRGIDSSALAAFVFDLMKNKYEARFEAMIVSYCLARENYSRGERHKRDHWKAMNGRRRARKINHKSLVLRKQSDEKYRESQKRHGWTEEFCRYLDHLTTINISCTAPWHQRQQYENTVMLVSNDGERQAGPMRARKGFKSHYSQVFGTNKDDRFLPNSEEREKAAKTI